MKKIFQILVLASMPLVVTSIGHSSASAAAVHSGKLGDLTNFEIIAQDTLSLVTKGDMPGAEKRITDFETAWDNAEPTLYPRDKENWSLIDDAADKAIGSLRTQKPSKGAATAAVGGLIKSLQSK